jgi:hypothetical protein
MESVHAQLLVALANPCRLMPPSAYFDRPQRKDHSIAVRVAGHVMQPANQAERLFDPSQPGGPLGADVTPVAEFAEIPRRPDVPDRFGGAAAVLNARDFPLPGTCFAERDG